MKTSEEQGHPKNSYDNKTNEIYSFTRRIHDNVKYTSGFIIAFSLSDIDGNLFANEKREKNE